MIHDTRERVVFVFVVIGLVLCPNIPSAVPAQGQTVAETHSFHARDRLDVGHELVVEGHLGRPSVEACWARIHAPGDQSLRPESQLYIQNAGKTPQQEPACHQEDAGHCHLSHHQDFPQAGNSPACARSPARIPQG